MEKNSNRSSSSSICSKIRQALASYPVFRAVHRIKQYTRSEPKPLTIPTHSGSPSSPPKHTAKNTAIQDNPPLPQHVNKVNTEGEGAIVPINFDYSTPSSSKGNNNGNSSSSSSSSSISKAHEQASKVASPHVGHSEMASKLAAKVEPEPQLLVPRQGKLLAPTKVEFVGSPTNKGTAAQGPLKGHHHHGLGMQHPEQQQGKKSLDINDTFAEYIQRAKHKIRTAPNVGRDQGNSAPDEANGYCGTNNTSTTNKMQNHKDHFSDFIQHAKKRLRTTSNVGKTGSLKRG